MKVRTQFVSLMFVLIVASILVSASLAIHSIRKNETAERMEFRALSMADVRQKLKNFVDIAYTTIEENHSRARDVAFLEKYYGRRLRSNIDIVECVLETQQKRVQRGEISLAAAKNEAFSLMKSVTLGLSKNILWMHEVGVADSAFTLHYPFFGNTRSACILNGARRHRNGRSLTDFLQCCSRHRERQFGGFPTISNRYSD